MLIGETGHGAKLTNEQADEIRAQRRRMSRGVLAAKYGVSKSTITKIWCGDRYRRIKKAPAPP